MPDEITLANGQTLDQFVTEVNAEITSLQQEVAALTPPNAAVGAVVFGAFAAQGASTSTVNAVGAPVLSGSGGGGTESTPTSNPENLTLSIQPGVFTFSNITPGNNTICIVSATNSKMQYPAWSNVQSNIKLDIDYAGYVHAMAAPGVGPITFTVQCVDTTGGSTAVASFSVPVVQIGAQTPTRAISKYVGLPTTGLVQNNTFLASGTAGIVGFNIANNTNTALPAGYARFVQPFVQGAVPIGNTLTLLEPTTSTPIQTDAINTYADGSIKTAIVTIAQPAIASGTSTQYLLGAIASGSATPIDLATALNASKYALTVAIDFLDLTGAQTNAQTLDIVAAMQSALIADTASYFQRGPLVTQVRAAIPVSGSLYINADISAFADGSIRTDLAIRNDLAMSAEGGPIYTSGVITQNGAAVYSWTQLYQTQYQAWFFECGTAPRYAASVQLDPAYLIKCAAVQPYNLTNGVNATTIMGYETIAITQANWLAPLNPNNVDTGMPGTGGRPDIGYLPQSATVAIITQDPRAIDYCCAQADASGSAPWNYYDAANGCFVSTANYPDIWLDQANRGGVGSPSVSTSPGPTQPTTTTPQAWALDQAHQPDLSFVPWLYTARRHYLDQVMSQGSWAVAGCYGRVMTIPGTSTVIKQSLWAGQVRGIGWNVRQVSNAAFCASDGTSYATYFPAIMAENDTYGGGLQDYLQSVQGAPYGYLAQSHGQNNFAPWEQNYLMPICALAGARGQAGWTSIANWFGRFTVESFMPQSDGPYQGANWCQRNGAAYELYVGVAGTSGQVGGTGIVGTPAQTWAALEYWTVVAGQSNGGETYDATTNTVTSGTPDWSHSAGDYGQLCLATLNWAVINNVPNAATALAWLQSSGAPYINQSSFQTDPTFSLAG